MARQSRFRPPPANRTTCLHIAAAPVLSQAHTVLIDTVQAIYCKRYLRQGKVAASWSQPAETYNIA
jgi:hypothetical protein